MTRFNSLKLLILLLAFSHGVSSTLARPFLIINKVHGEYSEFHRRGLLVVVKEQNGDKTRIGAGRGGSGETMPRGSPKTEVESDDFRPTTPGHSPGAGHATGPSNAPNN
ncbi:unnamed protein product [Linum trigynum]|uniref:Uncharacterized protein n=1 Tax=Linum trigynum TaxID=586398 RepID=A0AAV2FF77_9ROSI